MKQEQNPTHPYARTILEIAQAQLKSGKSYFFTDPASKLWEDWRDAQGAPGGLKEVTGD